MENNQANNTEIKDELDDVVELRTANSKHYRNSNGSYSAVIFDSPVHYLDVEDNTYKEIDMSLEEDNTRLFDGYKIKSNRFGVKFAKALSMQSLMVLEDRVGKIDISCGGYANRAMRLAANLGVVAKIDYTDKKVSARKKLLSQINATAFSAIRAAQTIPVVEKVKSIVEQRLEKFKKKASNIMYENAFVGADLEYVLSSNKIKENIIVGMRAELYEYTFTIRLDGFDMQLATDGSGINIVSKADGAVKYIIPAPFMYDANETRSDAVMLKLDKISDGVFELGIVADKTWINAPERALPVVIDPQIISTETSDIIMNSYNNGVLVPSGDNLNALGRCYGTLYDMKVEIKTPNVVSNVFSNDTRVLNATIELSKAYDARRADSKGFNVLKDGRVIDHFTYNGPNNRIDINITNELNAAIKGKDESSVFDIQAVDRTSTDDDYILILNSTDGNSEFRPKIMIDYVSDRLSLGASYHTSDVKRAGVGKVNLFNGNLTFTHTDLTADGSNLPFDLKHIYMSKLKGKEYDCELYGNTEQRLTPNFKMGKGWKMNIQQYLLKDEKDKTKATYLDGNGEVQLFEEKYFYEDNGVRKFVKKEQCIEKADGSLYITISENGNSNKYSVTHAYLTESGLLLFSDPNLKAVIAKSENRIIGEAYYVIYNGYKTPVIINNNKATFTRFYHTYGTINQHGIIYPLRNYYAEGEVEQRAGKYYLKSNPQLEVEKSTLSYEIKVNSNKERYFTLIRIAEERIPHGGVNYYNKPEDMYIHVEYKYDNDEVESSVLLFNNEDIMTLFDKAEELTSYLSELNLKRIRYNEEKNNITNPTETQQKLKEAINTYNSKQAELEAKGYENTLTLLSLRSQIVDKNYEYYADSSDNNLTNYYHSTEYNNLTQGKKEYLKTGYEDQLTQSAYDLGNLQVSIGLKNNYLESLSISQDLDMIAKQKELSALKDSIELYQKLKEERDEQRQIELLDLEIQKIDYQISKYEEVLKNVQEKLENQIETEKHKPIDYIVGESGYTLGFDYFGRLVEISDSNDNKTQINYDGDNINSITTKDGQLICFEYYYDRLNKIFDTRQRMTLFEYNNNGFLSKIVYPDNQAVSFDGNYDNRITEFKYNPYNELEEVIDQSGYAIKYMYNYFKQVETVKEYSYTQEISTGSFVAVEAPIDGEIVTIQYNNFKSTSIKNSRGESATYIFDNAGRAVSVYRDDQFVSEDKLNVTDAVNLSYKGRRKSYKVSISQAIKNYIKNADFENGNTTDWVYANNTGSDIYSVTSDGYVGGHNALRIKGNPQQARYAKQVIKAVDLPKGRNLIFAAWAKAQSAFIRSDRSSGYGDDIFENYNIDSFDPYKRDRKFGIRAEIKYEGYELETMETTFDWYNTAWQFTALPIRLLKDRKLESITLYLDYTNNINSVLFDNIQLIEGEGEYKEFYDDGKLRYSTNGKIDVFYPDYYNGMPTHIIRVDARGNRYIDEYVYDEHKRLLRSVGHDGIVTEYTYLDNGDLLKTETYHKDDPGSKYVSEMLYDDKGNVTGEKDSRGEVNGKTLSTQCQFKKNTNLLEEKISADGASTSYSYDYKNDDKLSIALSDDGENNYNLFEYKKGYLTRVYNDNVTFEYGYDGFGRNTFVKMNGDQYVDFSLQKTDDGGSVSTTSFANGDTIISKTDHFGNIVQLQYASSNASVPLTLHSSVYDENNRVTQFTDGLVNQIHSYEYDDKGRLVIERCAGDGLTTINSIEYDENNNITKSTREVGLEKISYEYEYGQNIDSKLLSTKLPNNAKAKYDYDKLGRGCGRTLYDENGNIVLRENTYYLKYGDHTTKMPSSVRFGLGMSLDEQIKYKYDKKGNITEIYKNGLLTNRYVYDILNRMVREDNKALESTTVFNYDTNGNILSKAVYGFTLGDILEKMPVSVKTYSYRADKWRDQLMSFANEKCEYDAIGNPIKYRGHATQYKYGGCLVAFDSVTYSYNGSKERVSKSVNGVVTQFITAGGNVIRSTTNGIVTDFYYDSYGLSGIKHNGVNYFVRKNVLGDITHIYDTTGTIQARYVYDAWGNHKVLNADGTEDTNMLSIGNINPIRYRGYFYDVETKLYYLKARYYDPEVGRFISVDDTIYLAPDTLNGLNLYAYCGDNPIMRTDHNGTSWESFKRKVKSFFTKVGSAISHVFTKLVQAYVSFQTYKLMCIGAIFSKSIRADMNRIGWNPFNTNVDAVLSSSSVSFYKGVPVFRYDNDRSGTFFVIMLQRDFGNLSLEGRRDVVRHERGHIDQLMSMGMIAYGLFIGIPSWKEFGDYDKNTGSYYNAPWEAMADIYGGTSRTHASQYDEDAEDYNWWAWLAGQFFGL